MWTKYKIPNLELKRFPKGQFRNKELVGLYKDIYDKDD